MFRRQCQAQPARQVASTAARMAGPIHAARNRAVRVRLGTLAPKGSSYTKHLQVMGEKWRQAPGGGALLTIYPDGTMGSEADMVRRMRLGQLQAGMLTAVGLGEIEPAVTGLQYMPMMFRSLEEVDYIGERLQPMLGKRLEEKGFVVLFWGDSGWVRFFSKQPIIRPDDLRKAKLFVWTHSAADLDTYRSVGCNPVPLETVDILPSLQSGLINAVPLPPSIALAGQVDRQAPHMLDLAYAPLVGAAVIMKKTWDAIPSEGRDSMRKAAAEAGTLADAASRRLGLGGEDAPRVGPLEMDPASRNLLVGILLAGLAIIVTLAVLLFLSARRLAALERRERERS